MLNVLFFVSIVGFVAISVRIWIILIRRWWHGAALVEHEPRERVCWGALDVVFAILFLFMLPSLAELIVSESFQVVPGTAADDLPLSYHYWRILALALASLATLVATAAVVMLRFRASPRVFGFVPEAAGRDIWLGIKAFLALAPPVYAIQYMLVQRVESKHPIVELLRRHPDPRLMLASIGAAVVVAPLVEELLFRGLFQGWLEKLVAVDHCGTERLLVGEPHDQAPLKGKDNRYAEQDRIVNEEGGREESNSPCGRPTVGRAEQAAEDAALGDESHRVSSRRWSWISAVPILGSSTVFAVLHMSHGPDWIPLFFLALGLGYLYRQTHRLLPCITVHLLLNGCSLAAFLLQLAAG